jgi:uncharacterized protein (DUF952 family)
MPVIYHVTTVGEWEKALQKGVYKTISLETEGFIHCCSMEQIPGVLQRYFIGKTNLIALTIHTGQLLAPVKYEPSPKVNELFPHIYGHINLDAVVGTPIRLGTL